MRKNNNTSGPTVLYCSSVAMVGAMVVAMVGRKTSFNSNHGAAADARAGFAAGLTARRGYYLDHVAEGCQGAVNAARFQQAQPCSSRVRHSLAAWMRATFKRTRMSEGGREVKGAPSQAPSRCVQPFTLWQRELPRVDQTSVAQQGDRFLVIHKTSLSSYPHVSICLLYTSPSPRD